MFREGDHPDDFDEISDGPEWRKAITEDPDALFDATFLWMRVVNMILLGEGKADDPREFNVRNIPEGFVQLTRGLAWWCDAGPFSIDPSPLQESLSSAQSIALESRLQADGPNGGAVDGCWSSREEARMIIDRELGKLRISMGKSTMLIDRMMYAAYEQDGREAPSATFFSNKAELPYVELNGDSSTVNFGGISYAVGYDQAVLVKELVDSYPAPKGLTNDDRPQPRRVINLLPDELLNIIQTTRKGSVFKV